MPTRSLRGRPPGRRSPRRGRATASAGRRRSDVGIVTTSAERRIPERRFDEIGDRTRGSAARGLVTCRQCRLHARAPDQSSRTCPLDRLRSSPRNRVPRRRRLPMVGRCADTENPADRGGAPAIEVEALDDARPTPDPASQTLELHATRRCRRTCTWSRYFTASHPRGPHGIAHSG